MASSDDSSDSEHLSPLQRQILDAFFARTQGFFLTGGAALAGFYLRHRDTEDLDLFASPEVDIGDGVRALVEAAVAIGASATILRESGDFKRYAVTRESETTLVDLVVDRAPQVAEKRSFGRIRVDAPNEIAANKLCALLDRFEVRDLVDLELLLATGLTLEAVLADAQKKHAGADPATLAWALSQCRIAPTAPIPAGIRASQVEAFRSALIATFTRMALPEG
jgi:predicted nucleotidyltransferase component of viral defense system